MELGENGADGGSLSFGGLERLWAWEERTCTMKLPGKFGSIRELGG